MIVPIEVIFFDLGDTLVKKAPGLERRVWVESAEQAMDRLHNEDVRLGIISDTGKVQRDHLFNELLPLDFDRSLFEERLIVLSSEVGVEKPDLRLFVTAVENAGVAPAKCLFCTEKLAHTLAAELIGMRCAWVQEGDLERLVSELLSPDRLISDPYLPGA